MEANKQARVTVQTVVQAPLQQVWSFWTEPKHIKKWNQASEDWHSPRAENDLRPGGKFITRMEAKDGSMGFDFTGVYDDVKHHELISYTLDDGRKVEITFTDLAGKTQVIETFDPESMNPVDFQQAGWQAILDHFKKYSEQQVQS